jgi:hypothetical protein
MKRKNYMVMMSEIETAFKRVKTSLKDLMEQYNPKGENLHFTHLENPDSQLYSQLVDLPREGLKLANNYKKILKRELYDDGMFWYDLCQAISSAALGVKQKNNQEEIPQEPVKELLRILVQISEFSVGTGGDMYKRNYEALGNTLYAFNSPQFLDVVVNEKERISSESISAFVDNTLERIKRIL